VILDLIIQTQTNKNKNKYMSNNNSKQLQTNHNLYNDGVNFVLIHEKSRKSITMVSESYSGKDNSNQNQKSYSFIANWYNELINILIDYKFIINAILITYICLFLILIVLNYKGISM
jgi:hypothetical protein